MNLVMDPAQALLDADSPPFVICEKAKGARIIVAKVALRDELEERLWEDHMSILVLLVRVSIGIVNSGERGLDVRYESGERGWWATTNLSMYSLIFASSDFSPLCDIVGQPCLGY